jgi:hypothetical protein
VNLIGLRQVDLRAPRFGSSWWPLAVDRVIVALGPERRPLPLHIERANSPLVQNQDLVACLAIIASIALPQSLLNS